MIVEDEMKVVEAVDPWLKIMLVVVIVEDENRP
jgi:hypothetical protein